MKCMLYVGDRQKYRGHALCRAKPPVGRHEMRGLFAGADAPNPAQLAAMGSRNALSPRRATALMRETLGHTTVSCLPRLFTPRLRHVARCCEASHLSSIL